VKACACDLSGLHLLWIPQAEAACHRSGETTFRHQRQKFLIGRHYSSTSA